MVNYIAVYIYMYITISPLLVGGRAQNVSYVFQGVFEGALKMEAYSPHKNDTWGTFSDQFYN